MVVAMVSLLRKVNFVLVVLLGFTAGIPKIMRVPDEVYFFEHSGIGAGALIPFGVVQVLGGVLVLIPRTRLWGAGLTALMLAGSTYMLVSTEQLVFAIVSTLPIMMAGVVIYDEMQKDDDED